MYLSFSGEKINQTKDNTREKTQQLPIEDRRAVVRGIKKLMSIHLSDRCWLLDSSQLWTQLKTHFFTSCQSLKCSSVFSEKEHRQPQTEENSSWGSPGD